jgi:site-specific DNA recombinase
LKHRGIPTQTGRGGWLSRTLWGILTNSAYAGIAFFGKTTSGARRQRLRPHRGQPEHPRRVRSLRTTPVEEQIPIPVPPLVSDAVFAAAQERLQENRKRNRRPPQGVRYLLQGLVVCKGCGYAYCGQSMAHARKDRVGRTYQYYFCTGSMFGRCDRERVCWNKSVRMDRIDAAVWEDVRALLAEPGRVEAEYRRRRDGQEPAGASSADALAKLLHTARRRVTRLIDAYEDGLMDKGEFEPRVRRARERLAQLTVEVDRDRERRATEADLRAVIGQLEAFAGRINQGLEEADWSTRRDVIRALVKRIEIDEAEVRVVYRVSPSPFVDGPGRGRLQDCVRRTNATSSR